MSTKKNKEQFTFKQYSILLPKLQKTFLNFNCKRRQKEVCSCDSFCDVFARLKLLQ